MDVCAGWMRMPVLRHGRVCSHFGGGGGKVITETCNVHHKFVINITNFVMNITKLWRALQICDEHSKFVMNITNFVMFITNL